MNRSQLGFTLVEIAIVLMIIGLLIGGVLRGQELLTNARVSSTIKQVTSYSAAMHSFQDAYNALPGDMNSAAQRLPGCSIAGNACQGGNGDGILGDPIIIYLSGQQGITTENTQFWKHLALVHLISGVNPDATEPVWGKSHPASPLSGGFTIIQSTNSSTALKGLALRLHMLLNGAVVETETQPATPRIGAQIDRKMDDGSPKSGNVLATASGVLGLANEAKCEIAYDETSDDPWCMMVFLIKR